MAHLREEVLNAYLGLLLDRYDGISATTEIRTPSHAIDITVTHSSVPAPVPILIEAKIGDTPSRRRNAAKQARSRLLGASRSLAFGLCYPLHLRDASVSSRATQEALARATIAFAPVRRTDSKPTWREGTVADLANTLRNTDLSRQRVADEIEWTVRKAAKLLYVQGCAKVVANTLNLPSKKDKDLRAAALVGSLILSNAALIHQRLRLVPMLSRITSLEKLLEDHDNSSSRIRGAWGAILDIDYHSIFLPALAVVDNLSNSELWPAMGWICENAVSVADDLASLRFDHAGPLYHRLLASAQFDGSFYTNHVSALLLARLALPEDLTDWSDADTLARLKVIDPACGTGTLLMAAMHTIRDRHEQAAADGAVSDLLHLALVEDALYGLDINRHGVQLAACNLTLGNPRIDYRRMNLFTMQHGPQSGSPTKAGSLEFLATARNERDIASFVAPLATTGELDAERAEPGDASTESLTAQFDLVIMNPPFTRNDIRNRQYSYRDRRRLQKREIEIARFLMHRDQLAFRAIDQTSVRTFFSPLSDALLKKKGATLAKVVPTTALTSASGHAERKFLANRFQIETVITSHDPSRINFSDSTAIHESLLVARRPEAERLATRFISLRKMPRDAHEAILLSDRINRGEPLGEWGTEHMWPWPRVREGDWTAALYYHAELAEAMRDLAALAGTDLIPAGEICGIEPGGQRVREAFDRKPKRSAPWTSPILWDHPTGTQTSMQATADVMASPKPDKERYARYTLLPKASRLLLANRLRTNTVRVAACYADNPLLGSSWVPVRPMTPNRVFEQALCAWWNSTPGILTLLHARAKALDYPRFALNSLRALLVPDPRSVDVALLADAFTAHRSTPLRPWPRMNECPTRVALDQAAARVLRLNGHTVARWRKLIGNEPTVSGSRPVHPLS